MPKKKVEPQKGNKFFQFVLVLMPLVLIIADVWVFFWFYDAYILEKETWMFVPSVVTAFAIGFISFLWLSIALDNFNDAS